MHDSGKAELTPFPPTPFILMGAPSNHTNIPLICLVVFPILAVSGRCVHTAMFKVVGPEDRIFPVSLADPLRAQNHSEGGVPGVVAQDCFGYEDL